MFWDYDIVVNAENKDKAREHAKEMIEHPLTNFGAPDEIVEDILAVEPLYSKTEREKKAHVPTL